MRRQFLALLAAIILAAAPALADQDDPRLDPLFDKLRTTEDLESALKAERRIWSIWLEHDDPEIERMMAVGTTAMNIGRLDDALAVFNQMIEVAPNYAEGWNKRATVAYYMGDHETSVHDIQKTLALEPRHFGALSGLAMIYEAEGLEAQALDALIQVKEIHPTMPGLDAQMEALRKAIEAKKT